MNLDQFSLFYFDYLAVRSSSLLFCLSMSLNINKICYYINLIRYNDIIVDLLTGNQNLLLMRKTIQYIDSHPLNRSKTKEAHSFSKSPRFSKVTEGSRTTFYELSKSAVNIRPRSPGVKFQREIRFKDWNKTIAYRKQSPSPNSYTYPDFFQLSGKQNKGVSFARSPKKQERIEEKPGPGTYNTSKYNPEHEKVYTISKQKKLNQTFWNKLGPGEYETDVKQKPMHNTIIGNAKRFTYKQQQTPSPNQYFKNLKFDHQSKVHSKSPKFSFGTSRRQLDLKTNKELSPGPGSYNNSFSQFSERSQRIFNILKRL